MSTIVWLFLGANAVALAGLAVQLSNLSEFRRVSPVRDPEPVDVYVAMRDEAENAQAFLATLLCDSSVARVVVADDASTDATASLVAAAAAHDPRIAYVRVNGGKSAALAAAVAAYAPRTRWIAFVDADVRLRCGAAGALVRYAQTRDAAAATAWLCVDAPSLSSKLLAPLVTLFLLQALPMRAARGTDPRFSAGNGQCFVVRADAYEQCGGHAAIREIVEDVALARALKRSGFRVALASGAAIGSVRGYATLRANLRGLGRSLFYGAGPAGCVAFALWQMSLLLSAPTLYLSRAISGWSMREPLAGVLLAPAGTALGVVLGVNALVQGLRGRLAWRGRHLSGGESAARP